MTSKQLFISFLSLCCVSSIPVYAFKQNVKGMTGIGVPARVLSVDDFDVDALLQENQNEGNPGIAFTMPLPEEETESEEKAPQGVRGRSEQSLPSQDDGMHYEPINNNNSAHILDQQLGGAPQAANVAAVKPLLPVQTVPSVGSDSIPEATLPLPDSAHEDHEDNAHTHEEHQKDDVVSRQYLQKAKQQTEWVRDIIVRHPQAAIVSGAMGIIVVRLSYAGWQWYTIDDRINHILKQYGKNLSTISPVHAMLMKAAYKQDFDTVQKYIAQDDMKSLLGDNNAWVIPAMEHLVKSGK